MLDSHALRVRLSSATFLVTFSTQYIPNVYIVVSDEYWQFRGTTVSLLCKDCQVIARMRWVIKRENILISAVIISPAVTSTVRRTLWRIICLYRYADAGIVILLVCRRNRQFEMNIVLHFYRADLPKYLSDILMRQRSSFSSYPNPSLLLCLTRQWRRSEIHL